MLATNLLGLNPWLDFLMGVVIIGGSVWGVVWGAIRYYHKYQMKELSEKIMPLFTTVSDKFDILTSRLDDQDAVLTNVEHEVAFNNGSSVKDAINRVELNQIEDRKARVKMAETVEKIDHNLIEHLGVHKGMLMASERRV